MKNDNSLVIDVLMTIKFLIIGDGLKSFSFLKDTRFNSFFLDVSLIYQRLFTSWVKFPAKK